MVATSQCYSEIISTIGNLENLLATGDFRVFDVKLLLSRQQFNSNLHTHKRELKCYLLTSIFMLDLNLPKILQRVLR